MSKQRTERDHLGSMEIAADALYGIHTRRANTCFPLSGRYVAPELRTAYGAVKWACAITNHNLGYLDARLLKALEQACQEMIDGLLQEWIVVESLHGGAGTSVNMNVNEVLANRALQIMGENPGRYRTIHPIEDVNRHQSTNDTFPTALKVAAIQQLRLLEPEITALQEAFQDKEKAFGGIIKIGRTQLQDAVLTTMGRTMSAFAEAFGRDRWRIYKCEERLRVVNLGGTAIGTGLSAPRQYIFEVVDVLKKLTGIGLARAENGVDQTQNLDAFVEVSGILNTLAVNLQKSANDIRLMASGPDSVLGELILPPVQAGSSIMPGKINPVIPEAVMQAAMAVTGNHQKITAAAANGNLELNAFLPLIAEALLENIRLLKNAVQMFRERCISGLRVNEKRCRQHVENSTATVTALVQRIGYEQAGELLREKEIKGGSVKEIAVRHGWLTENEFEQLITPENVLRLGFPSGEGCP
ncbi:MAG: aspartate ammonia-lyase [Caldithrix sp.]|nr:aspartate ammonia-lyase [Caldithrix sp.]